MSTTTSHTSTVPFAPQPADLAAPVEPVYYGLALSAWVKVITVAALMAALFRFNLSRLWAKTNPFTGQPNWEHSMVIPVIGLYYLYVWRDDLLRPRRAPGGDATAAAAAAGEPWTSPGVWGVIGAIGAAVVALACLAYPPLALYRTPRVLGVSLPWAAIVTGLWFGVAAGLVYGRRDFLRGERFNRSMTSLWRLLGAWLLANLALWGVGFFLSVVVGDRFNLVNGAVSAVGLASLGTAVAYRAAPRARALAERVLDSSAGWFGGYVLVWGILFSLWGIYPGQNDFFKDVGMVIALFGVVLALAGWRVMRTAWFPIVFLFCALPWPDLIYSWVAGPLQLLAAKVAVHVMQIFGIDAANVGTKINFVGAGNVLQTLNVAEACSGLRSLMTFVSVAAAIAFLSARPLWQKLVIVCSAVPIAIACNVMRVSGQGLLHRYAGREWSEGFAHGFAGLVMLIPGFFLILGVGWIMDHLFVEEMEDADRPTAGARRGAAPAAGLPALAGATASAALKPAVARPAARSSPDGIIQVPRPAAQKPARPPMAPAPAPPAAGAATAATKPAAAAPAPAARRPTASAAPAANAAAAPASAAPVRRAPAKPATPAAGARAANDSQEKP